MGGMAQCEHGEYSTHSGLYCTLCDLEKSVEHLKQAITKAHDAGCTYDDIYPILRTLSDVGYFVE
jgi:hypothetical protein